MKFKIKKKHILIGVLAFLTWPLLPVYIGIFIARHFYKKQSNRNKGIMIAALIIVASFIPTTFLFAAIPSPKHEPSNTSSGSTANSPVETQKPTSINLKSIAVMSGGGIHGITFETELSGYQSEMENPEPITVSLADTTIPVEGRDKIEVIVEYDDVELKQPGLFGGGSRFYIIDYEGQQQNPSNAGGQTSFKIENNKAGVSLSPWVHIYDNFKGGQAKLVMELVPAMGEKLIKEWTLDISPYVLNSDR